MTVPPGTGWRWHFYCLLCGTAFTLGTISPSSLLSPSPWPRGRWVLFFFLCSLTALSLLSKFPPENLKWCQIVLKCSFVWEASVIRQVKWDHQSFYTNFLCLYPPDTEIRSSPLLGFQRLEAGLWPFDLGSHSAGHLLHRHAFSSSCRGVHFYLLQVCPLLFWWSHP